MISSTSIISSIYIYHIYAISSYPLSSDPRERDPIKFQQPDFINPLSSTRSHQPAFISPLSPDPLSSACFHRPAFINPAFDHLRCSPRPCATIHATNVSSTQGLSSKRAIHRVAITYIYAISSYPLYRERERERERARIFINPISSTRFHQPVFINPLSSARFHQTRFRQPAFIGPLSSTRFQRHPHVHQDLALSPSTLSTTRYITSRAAFIKRAIGSCYNIHRYNIPAISYI